MIQHTFLGASVGVFPMDAPTDNDADQPKVLKIIDPQSGQIFDFPMVGELAKDIGAKMRMSNSALKDKLEREQAAAQVTDGVPEISEALRRGAGPGASLN